MLSLKKVPVADSAHVPNCKNQTTSLLPISDERLTTLETKSKKRKDELHLNLKKLDASQRLLLRTHGNCLNTYISETHIARYFKNVSKDEGEPSIKLANSQ